MKALSLSLVFLMLACSSKEKSSSKSESITDAHIAKPSTSKKSVRKQLPVESVVETKTSDLYSELKEAYFANDEKRLEDISTKLFAKDADDLKALTVLGNFRFKQSKFEMARLHWEQALRKYPNESSLYNNLGMLELKYGDEAKALSFFKEAIRKDSNNASASANVGIIYLKYRNYKSAQAALELAYEADNKSASIANHYALALRGSGQTDKALSVLDKALKLYPRQAELIANYAGLLIETGKDIDQGLNSLNRLRLLSQDPAILKYVGAMSKLAEQKKSERKAE